MSIKNIRKLENKKKKKKITILAVLSMLASGIELTNDSLELLLNFLGEGKVNEIVYNSKGILGDDYLIDSIDYNSEEQEIELGEQSRGR